MAFIPDTNQQSPNNFKPTSGFIPDEIQEAPQNQGPKLFGSQGLTNLAEGMGQGVLNTATNIGKLGGSTINWAMGKGFTPNAEGGLQMTKLGQKLSTAGEQRPDTSLGKFGFGAEQLAEFLVPSPLKVAKIPKAATTYAKALNLTAKSISQALDFGARTAAQTNGDKTQTITSTVLGGMFPIGGAVLTKALPLMGDISASILGNMIGKEPQHIKLAFQNPIEVGKAITAGAIPLEIRQRAVSALKSFDAAVKETFAKGLDVLQGKTPSHFAPGKYNASRQIMKNDLQNSMTGMPQTFRDFKVSVLDKGATLNFDKMNSSIVKSGERSNVEMAWDTIRNQTDFSPSGVQATASRLYALRRFGDNNESSALVNSMYSRYLSSIKTVYPELAKLRTEYGIQQDIINGVDEVIKSTKKDIPDPTAVTGAVRKLSNLFNEDGEAYLNAIKLLEKKTGVNLLKDLAASEFINYVPASMGSRIAQAGLLTGGFVYNPWMLAVLPLFSPRFVGRLSTTAGRIAPAVQTASQYVAPTVTSGVQQVQRGLEFNQ